MTVARETRKLKAAFRARPTLRAGSLIITVFGDAIAPRGGTVWIGSLIAVLDDFGISERLVRTSVFRLARDGWLTVNRIGRRSYYSLTDQGARKFRRATARIYGQPRPAWSGKWCLVLLADLAAEEKEAVRRELGWLGFAPISASILAHPAPDLQAFTSALEQTGIADKLIVMHAETTAPEPAGALRNLVHARWNLAEIDAGYRELVARFRPVFKVLQKAQYCDERQAFVLRTLLIHDYRRVLLRDPLLPDELLPARWHGTAAYQLCRNLYRHVAAPADRFLGTALETAEGPLPPPAAEFFERFGGLE